MPHRLVRSADEAAAAAEALGLPVALKIVSPDITHKTDLGGVVLNLATPEAVRRAFGEVTARVRKAAPQASLGGCLVAPMVTGGVETILGAQWDPVFGPVVMLGLGGVFVEALKDVTFRLAPFDEAEARRMIAELRAQPVLHGHARPPARRSRGAGARAGGAFALCRGARPGACQPRHQPVPGVAGGTGRARARRRPDPCLRPARRGFLPWPKVR